MNKEVERWWMSVLLANRQITRLTALDICEHMLNKFETTVYAQRFAVHSRIANSPNSGFVGSDKHLKYVCIANQYVSDVVEIYTYFRSVDRGLRKLEGMKGRNFVTYQSRIKLEMDLITNCSCAERIIRAMCERAPRMVPRLTEYGLCTATIIRHIIEMKQMDLKNFEFSKLPAEEREKRLQEEKERVLNMKKKGSKAPNTSYIGLKVKHPPKYPKQSENGKKKPSKVYRQTDNNLAYLERQRKRDAQSGKYSNPRGHPPEHGRYIPPTPDY